MRMAMDLWEDKLNIREPITFSFAIDEGMPPELEMLTTVIYHVDAERGCIPYNLQRQFVGMDEDYRTTITANAYTDWDSSWAYDIPYGTDNLTTSLLRHIAHILGFGASVVGQEGDVGFACYDAASAFDMFVVSDSQQPSFVFSCHGDLNNFLCVEMICL